MNQKQKIIIVLITSLTVIGSSSYLIYRSLETKDNQENVTIKSSPEKQSIDNSLDMKKKKEDRRPLPKPLSKVEEKSPLTFWKVIKYLLIIILIVFVIRFVIIYLDNYARNKRIQKFFQEGRITIDIQGNNIYVLFGTQKIKKYQTAEKLFQQDILNAQLPNAPENVQTIYDKLKQKKENIIKIGELIEDFFFIFSHLLFDTYSFSVAKNIDVAAAPIKMMFANLTNAVGKNVVVDPEFDKRTYQIFAANTLWKEEKDSQKLDLLEGEDPIQFFQKTVTDQKETYYQNGDEKIFLFNHYFVFYRLIKIISNVLDVFFADPNIKKDAEYQKYKQDYLNIINDLNALLGIKKPQEQQLIN